MRQATVLGVLVMLVTVVIVLVVVVRVVVTASLSSAMRTVSSGALEVVFSSSCGAEAFSSITLDSCSVNIHCWQRSSTREGASWIYERIDEECLSYGADMHKPWYLG